MMALSVFGNSRTGSEIAARRPRTRIIKLTTVASTGRRMKRSVNPLIARPPSSLLDGSRVRHGRRVARIVDRHRRPVAQLDLPGGHHGLALLESVFDRHLVAPRQPGLHQYLARDE